MCDHFEASQKKICVQNRVQIRQTLKKLEFEASRDSVYWFKMLILIKTVEEHHKLSFETICIDVWSFWSFLVAKKWLKIGPNWGSKLQKIQFEASRGSDYWFKMFDLIKTIGGHQKLSFETICINVWSFWAIPETKEWFKIRPN